MEHIWQGCTSLHLVYTTNVHVYEGVEKAFVAGYVHDALYFLNMVNSENIPFIDCIMAALNTWT